MGYKKVINIRDPSRINNYNKFLKTLDNNNNNNNNNNTKLCEIKKNLETEESIKDAIDKIIDHINNNFKINDYSSSNFTGQTYKDLNYVIPNNPNDYKDFLDQKYNCKLYSCKNQLSNNKNKEVYIREYINIDAEINNISDILSLIERYQNDSAVKYNINIQALHDIKEPLQELNNMIGMNSLKDNIVDQILYFIQELHKNDNSSGEFLHTVIYGPPGTGKTEIAKIMGKIYSKIGILSKGTFTKVTRSDLVAGYLGQTALKTKDVIKEALGGVLFIDEAYSLGNPEKRDSFSKECIDTLCEALSDNKENLMVIIAGYEKELKECFFNYNQGLDSRFTWRFKTDNYTAEDLHKIFLKKVKDIGWEIEDNSNINAEWFKKNKEYFRFYGRDIETLLTKTKICHSRRVFCKPESDKKRLKLIDLDKGLQMYLNNDDIKKRKDAEEFNRNLYHTLYS
jgi:SpoVK/Ycf46/Vps4 family AAA+-type ATPase